MKRTPATRELPNVEFHIDPTVILSHGVGPGIVLSTGEEGMLVDGPGGLVAQRFDGYLERLEPRFREMVVERLAALAMAKVSQQLLQAVVDAVCHEVMRMYGEASINYRVDVQPGGRVDVHLDPGPPGHADSWHRERLKQAAFYLKALTESKKEEG